MNNTHKICIIKPNLSYCFEEQLASTIQSTDWVEVDHDTFKMLMQWQSNGDFTVIEMPEPQPLIQKTVADYIKWIQQMEAKNQEEKRKRELKKQQRELKKLAKTEQQEQELLEQLKQKYETKQKNNYTI